MQSKHSFHKKMHFALNDSNCRLFRRDMNSKNFILKKTDIKYLFNNYPILNPTCITKSKILISIHFHSRIIHSLILQITSNPISRPKLRIITRPPSPKKISYPISPILIPLCWQTIKLKNLNNNEGKLRTLYTFAKEIKETWDKVS